MSSNPPPVEPLYVVDTNALIWYLTNDNKLGKRASAIFDAAERGETLLIVSAITLDELYFANAKHRWFDDFSATYHALVAAPFFLFAPHFPEDVLAFDQHVAVPEMHDRIIVGLAQRLNAPLIASDPEIVNANIVTVEW